MIENNNNWISPTRSINARVELYSGSTLVDTFTKNHAIKSFKIERIGEEGKFFGFGITHKLILDLVDKDRVININKNDELDVSIGTNDDPVYSVPFFYVDDVKRDENTNALTITAYCKLQEASKHTVAELNLEAPYSLWDVLEACRELLGFDAIGIHNEYEAPILEMLNIIYQDGANLDGTETIREILDAIAEVTQSIYYITNSEIIFKSLNYVSMPYGYGISRDNYFTLECAEARKLTSICHATELGDNITATSGEAGETQYIRNNPFLELRDDVADILENAISNMNGLTIVPYTCKWRGDFSLEPGDIIHIDTKDNGAICTYLLNDTIEFNGGLAQTSSWKYSESAETASNPSTLGEALKQTYAKVDKANKEIEIVADEVSTLKITTDSVVTSVTKIDDNVNKLANTVSTKVSADEMNIAIEKQLMNGVDKVTTTTGFTFDEEGLHISKSNSEISTSITEDGMVINKESAEVLKANNEGVKAVDLHATTYLIIGNNSRLEDYGASRTGCFWIGG